MVTHLKAPIKTESEYLEKWSTVKPNATMKAPFLAKSFMVMENSYILMEELSKDNGSNIFWSEMLLLIIPMEMFIMEM